MKLINCDEQRLVCELPDDVAESVRKLSLQHHFQDLFDRDGDIVYDNDDRDYVKLMLSVAGFDCTEVRL